MCYNCTEKTTAVCWRSCRGHSRMPRKNNVPRNVGSRHSLQPPGRTGETFVGFGVCDEPFLGMHECIPCDSPPAIIAPLHKGALESAILSPPCVKEGGARSVTGGLYYGKSEYISVYSRGSLRLPSFCIFIPRAMGAAAQATKPISSCMTMQA